MGELHSLPRRALGVTGLRVSPLGLAAMPVPAPGQHGPGLRPEDVEQAFYEHAINTFFVTRQMKAHTEGVRRLIQAGHRDKLVIISIANLPLGGSIRRAWEKNARALNTDVLDIYLLGWVQGRWYVGGETWRAMRRLKDEGKVRGLGFSCHNRILAAALARELAVDALMIRYNASHRGAEREVFEPLGNARPAIIAYTATRWGMLLRPLPRQGFPRPMSAGECYRFVLSHPAVDVVLCAARGPEELREDVAAVLEGPLTPARMEEARHFGDAVHAAARGGWRWMFRQG